MNLVMMGTGLFAEPTLESLIASRHRVVGLITQPDRHIGHERGSTRQTGKGMKNIALMHGVPVFQPESINTPEGITGLRAMKPDLLVVAAYGQILAREVLEVAPRGGINVHASLLPRYRGAAPIAWAIYHGESVSGITIIRMTTGLDAGEMLLQEETPILAEETTGELEARLAPLGARLALQIVERLEMGPVQGIRQDPALVTRAPKLKKEHGAIRWDLTGKQICQHVRAMQPWPTAYTFFHHAGHEPLRIILCRATARPRTPTESALQPGEIITEVADFHTLRIAAGEGTIVEIQELQPAGKRRMKAEEFLRGHRPHPGDRLGPLQP